MKPSMRKTKTGASDLWGKEVRSVFKSMVLGVGAVFAKTLGKMAFAHEISLFKDPGVAAFGVGEDLPSIVVQVPEVKAVSAMPLDGFGDVFDRPFLGLLTTQLIGFIDLLIGQHIEAIVVAAEHFIFVLDLNHGIDMGAAELHHHGDVTCAHHLEAQKFLIKSPRLL